MTESELSYRDMQAENAKLREQVEKLVSASVRAFLELNGIRARDGVPHQSDGRAYGVDEKYFSSVVDGLDEAVKAATGKSAHFHPALYREATTEEA